MAFETIECVNPPASTTTVPNDGVSVAARSLTLKKAGRTARFIKVTIGDRLASGIGLSEDEHRLTLSFGTAGDAGKIKVSANPSGQFLAKRQSTGRYALTINEASAEGLFALEFPNFDRKKLEVLKPSSGAPPHFVFAASEAMLAVDD